MNKIRQVSDAWNRGYQSTPIRSMQSLGLMALVAGLLAAGIGIGAGIAGTNALDFYKSVLSNHTFQLGSLGLGALMAGYLFRRITHTVLDESKPDIEKGTRSLQAGYVILITALLLGGSLGVAAFAQNVDYLAYSMNMLQNHTFALSTVAGGGFLAGYLLNRSIHDGKSIFTNNTSVKSDTKKDDLYDSHLHVLNDL